MHIHSIYPSTRSGLHMRSQRNVVQSIYNEHNWPKNIAENVKLHN